MERLFSDIVRPIQGAAPSDLDTAVTGKRIKMDKAERFAAILQVATSLASTVQLNLRQHDAAAGGNSKALTTKTPWFVKEAADLAFTKKNAANAEISQADASTELSTAAGTVIMNALAEDLDKENGYHWISVDIADTTVAKLGSLEYHLSQLEHKPGYELEF